MDAIFFFLRTGCLNATGICSSSSAHRRFKEWHDSGIFERFWQNGLLACEHLDSIDWSWLSMDGCMTKSPLSGTKTGRNPKDKGKQGVKRSLLTDARGFLCRWSSQQRTRTTSNWLRIRSMPFRRGIRGKLRLCLDKGYEAGWLKTYLQSRRYEPHIQSRKEESDASKNRDFKALSGALRGLIAG
jgi:hypothetical protein